MSQSSPRTRRPRARELLWVAVGVFVAAVLVNLALPSPGPVLPTASTSAGASSTPGTSSTTARSSTTPAPSTTSPEPSTTAPQPSTPTASSSAVPSPTPPATSSPTATAAAGSPSATPSAVPLPAGVPAWDQLDLRWGTYVPEREWGTPREAVGGDGWGLSYTAATREPYRWTEDGIAGVSDRAGAVVVSWAFWDGQRSQVTERYFGFSNPQGEHGESIVDDRVLLENTPTHSYARQVYRYGSGKDPEFTVELEMARMDSETLLMRATATESGTAPAPLHVVLRVRSVQAKPDSVAITPLERGLLVDGRRPVAIVGSDRFDAWQATFGKGDLDARLRQAGLTGQGSGPYGALDTLLELTPSTPSSVTVAVAEAEAKGSIDPAIGRASAALAEADVLFASRHSEAARLFAGRVTEHEPLYQAALDALLWNESLYRWDGTSTALPRWHGTVDANDVLIMPDKWEYPYVAAWDSGFQAVTASLIDPKMGAAQLRFLLSNHWQQPDGHVPCAEWVMDVECPPVLAWAAWRVYEAGHDEGFLDAVYPGLVAQYDYWQRTRQVEPGLYGGGFLGMDDLPRAAGRPQADGSAWMAWNATWLARIAEQQGQQQDKERFLADREIIAVAVNARLWDEARGIYADVDDSGTGLIGVSSYAGLIPLIADIVPPERRARMIAALEDEAGFLSPAGIRSVPKSSGAYQPGYAGRGVNSNWLGPVWLPIDYLLVDAVRETDPELAATIRDRTVSAVEADWQQSGHFHEYFDGDTGAGLGADEQAGWTALVANLIAEGWPSP